MLGDHPTDASAYIFPQPIYVPQIPNTRKGHESFVRTFLSSDRRSAASVVDVASNSLDSSISRTQVDASGEQANFVQIRCPTILICGHNSRDTRCGILGPLLRTEFRRYINSEWQNPVEVHGTGDVDGNLRQSNSLQLPKVALISHIGGHAFAGNIIIYIPNEFRTEDGTISSLAGRGVWYGRVEPKHVWGIMQETVKNGRVIQELLRGVHDPWVDKYFDQ